MIICTSSEKINVQCSICTLSQAFLGHEWPGPFCCYDNYYPEGLGMRMLPCLCCFRMDKTGACFLFFTNLQCIWKARLCFLWSFWIVSNGHLGNYGEKIFTMLCRLKSHQLDGFELLPVFCHLKWNHLINFTSVAFLPTIYHLLAIFSKDFLFTVEPWFNDKPREH